MTPHGDPLRICLVAPYDLSTRGGGVKHHIFGLAAALRARGDRVTILGPASRPVTEPGVVTVGGIVSIQSNGSANEIALFASPLDTARFFDRRTFDVIHVHDPPIPSLAYWVAWLTPGIPKLCTFHAYADAPPLPLRVGQRLFGAVQYPFFDRALAVSVPAAEYAARAWTRPLVIVPNGVDEERFRPRAPHAPPGLRLLFVGRLADARKGWSVMLDAYQRLLARVDGVTLDVVGDAAGVAPPALPGLRIHGALPLSELVDHYQRADVFVAPSTGQESFGIVLLEAMAAGCPIVCSDIRGYREVVSPTGAELVPPADASALADAILGLLRDPSRAAAMRARNLETVQAYAWPRVAEQIREHYVDLVGATRARRAAQPAELAASRAPDSKRRASTNPNSRTGTV